VGGRIDPGDVLETATHNLGKREVSLPSHPLGLPVEIVGNLNLRLDHHGKSHDEPEIQV
jgi:hypothetical protein